MSTNTNHLGLIKPSPTDYYDIEVFNSNADSIDGAIKWHDDRIADIENNFDMKNSIRSEPVVTQDHITSVPEGTVSGGSVEICGLEGLSLVNQVRRVSSDNTFTADGNGSLVGIKPSGELSVFNTFSPTEQTIDVTVGDKVFIYFKLADDSNGKLRNRMHLIHTDSANDSIGDSSESHSELYGIVTASKTGKVNVKVTESGNGTASFQSIVAICLKGSLENLTEDQLIYMVRKVGYWEGIRSVVNPKIVSRGKNKFPKDVIITPDYYIGTTGKQVHVNGELTDFIEVKPNTNYITNAPNKILYVGAYDLNKTFLRRYSTVQGFLTESDVSYVRLSHYDEGGGYFDGFQLEEGIQPSEYEFYQSTESIFNSELRSLPNGITDSIETAVIDGRKKVRKVERVGVMYLELDDFNSIEKSRVNFDYVRVNKPIDSSLYGRQGSFEDTKSLMALDFSYTTNWDDTPSNANKFGLSTDSVFVMSIEKDLYTDIQEASEGMHGIELHYQLIKPVYGEWQEFIPTSFEGGDIILSSDSGIIPEIRFTTPLNQGAVIRDVAKKVSAHQQFIEDVTGAEMPPVKLSSQSPTVSFDVNNGGVTPVISGSGSSITNLVVNGDFSDGTNWWVSEESSSLVTSKVLSNTADGSLTYGRINQFDSNKKLKSGDKVFAYSKVKATNSSCKRINLFIRNNVGNPIQSVNNTIANPIIDTWYDVYGIITTTADYTNGTRIYIEHSYKDATTAKGKVMEVDGNTGVFLINMTALGIDNYTEQQMLDIVSQGYIKGTKNLTNLKFDIRVENLFNPSEAILNYSLNGSGSVSNVDGFAHSNLIPLDSANDYIISGRTQTTIDYYDSHYNFIRSTTGTNSVELQSGESFIRFNLNKNDIDSCMLTEGAVPPTEYIEPFHNQVYAPVTLTSKDNYTIDGGNIVVDRKVRVIDSLDGIDYDWRFELSETNFKRISISDRNDTNGTLLENTMIVTKFDGMNITNVGGTGNLSSSNQCAKFNSEIWLTISNYDSGWSDSYTPTSDEIKAYMNGWVMFGSGGVLYESGQKAWYKRYQGIGTRGSTAFGAYVQNGTALVEVPKEKAYGDITETYNLQYDLAEPVREEIDLFGDLTMPEGKVYLNMKSGIYKEDITKKLFIYDTVIVSLVYINDIGSDSILLDNQNPLLKKVEKILKIEKVVYENNATVTYDDTSNWDIRQTGEPYGKERAVLPLEKYDKNAQYLIEYKTLSSENNTNVFDAQLTHKDDLINVIQKQGEKIAYQAEQLDLAEMKIKELTNVIEFEPTLLNGALGVTGKYGVRVTNGYVELFGYLDVITSGNYSSGETFADIGSKLAPKETRRFTAGFNSTSISESGHITVTQDGEIKANWTGSPDFIYLDNVRWRIGC